MDAISIDTFGWNTAFALKVSDVNRLLAFGVPVPKSFDFTLTPIRGQWSFAPWIVKEASGSQITLELRFADGTLARKAGALSLTGVVCEVTCEMVLKPVERPPETDSTVNAFTPRPGDTKKWAAVEIVDDEEALSLSERGDLQRFLEAWFRTPEALVQFEKQFTGIKINTFVARDGLAWLKPRAIGFAGATSPDNDRLFGILAKTLDKDITGCPYQLSPYGIPRGAQAGLAISAETFLAKLMLPALAHVFDPHAEPPSKDFSIHDRNKLWNIARLDLPFRTQDGHRFTGAIAPHQFDVVLSGAELTIKIHDMTVPVNFGPIREVATIHLTVEHRLGLRLASPKDEPDHKVFSLFERAPPQVTLSTQESTGLVIAKITAEVLALVVAAVAAYFTQRGLAAKEVKPFVTKLVAALTFFIVDAIGEGIAHIPDLIEYFESESLRKLPDFSRFVDCALSEISWPKNVTYRAVSAEFRDSALIGVCLKEE